MDTVPGRIAWHQPRSASFRREPDS